MVDEQLWHQRQAKQAAIIRMHGIYSMAIQRVKKEMQEAHYSNVLSLLSFDLIEENEMQMIPSWFILCHITIMQRSYFLSW